MHMPRLKSVLLACAGVAVAAGLIAAPQAARMPQQAKIEAKTAPLLEVERLNFKDLNRNGALDPYEDWRLPVEKRAADLVSRMTLEEKAGLMQITSFNAAALEDYINKRNIRYLILRDNAAGRELASRTNACQEVAEKSRLGIPLVFTANPRNHIRDTLVYEEAEASGQWPGTLGLAATRDLKLIADFAGMARAEWRSGGIRKMYGYQVDVVTEPRWYRNQTTFGEDPALTSEITKQLVLGFQGRSLGPESVALTIKHFPGDGAVDKGLDPHNSWGRWAVYPTPVSLFKYQLPPFQAAVDAGASSIMCFYNVPSNAKSADQIPKDWRQSDGQQFEEVAGAYNEAILKKLLRGHVGFKGYVNSDSGVLGNMAFGVEDLTLPQRFARAVKAGVSVFSDNNNPQGLIDAVKQGLLNEEDIEPSVTYLLKEMFQLGLFENPYTDPETAQKIAGSPATATRANQAHRQSIVLLRNDRKLLPMTGAKKLYVEVFAEPVAGGGGFRGGQGFGGPPGAAGRGDAGGRGAAGPQARGGRGPGSGAARNSAAQTAALKALFARDPSVQVVESLEEADAAVVWLRPSVYQRPEHDYADIALSKLTGIDVDKVRQIEAAKPTVLIVNFITPWIVNEVEPGAAAVLATFDVKAEAVLDVVRGRFSPTGKLPITIPADRAAVDRNASDVPGYAEAFDYAYKNGVNDRYVLGFGLKYTK